MLVFFWPTLYLTGVGGITSVCPHGRYTVTIPTYDGKKAKLSGLCLDTITGSFPNIPLAELEDVVHTSFKNAGHNPATLPKLPDGYLGGETDLMIGVAYLKYFPK